MGGLESVKRGEDEGDFSCAASSVDLQIPQKDIRAQDSINCNMTETNSASGDAR